MTPLSPADAAALFAERSAAALGILSRTTTRLRTRSSLLSQVLVPVLREDARLVGKDLDDLAALIGLHPGLEHTLPGAFDVARSAVSNLVRPLTRN